MLVRFIRINLIFPRSRFRVSSRVRKTCKSSSLPGETIITDSGHGVLCRPD